MTGTAQSNKFFMLFNEFFKLHDQISWFLVEMLVVLRLRFQIILMFQDIFINTMDIY